MHSFAGARLTGTGFVEKYSGKIFWKNILEKYSGNALFRWRGVDGLEKLLEKICFGNKIQVVPLHQCMCSRLNTATQYNGTQTWWQQRSDLM